MPRFLIILLCVSALLRAENPAASPDPAGDEVRAGHSHQGEAFNEGPRQSAILIPGTGAVNFPITTDWRDGQKFFDQGLGQLHGFWYYEAERSFRELAAHDPECAMAYWGMAMANWENEKRAKGFIEKAVALKEHATPHNRLYIEAQANYLDGNPKDAKKRQQELLNDLENIIHAKPEDHEARAFLACRLWQFKRKGMPIHSHEAVDAVLQQIFAEHPMHPAHHYRIHLWDGRKAERALDSAAKLGHTAPAIAHMWHMPGHIYSKLKRWDDSAFAQEASARIDHQYMRERRVLPDQIHNYAHNNEWLTRNWMNLGRARDALRMAQSLVANPRHPKLNTFEGKAHSAKYGRQRLFEVLERFELWEEALSLADTPWLEPTELPVEQAKRLRLIALASFETGQAERLHSCREALSDLLKKAKQDQEKAKTEAKEKAGKEKKNEKDTEKMIKDAGKKDAAVIAHIERTESEMEFYLALLEDNIEKAKKKIGNVRRQQFELARLHLRLGDEDKALALSKEAVDKGTGQALPLLARIEILHALGKKEETRATFKALGPLSSHLDQTAPPIARVLAVAEKLGLSDWQSGPVARDDVGDRPDLDTLGPVTWTPPSGHDFSLPDQDGNTVTAASYRGRPLILIFYLGHGCLHCSDQLNAFAKATAEFTEAGYEILAISTDTVADLRKSQQNYSADGGTFPFPLVADPELETFRQWGAYDDFEKEAIHGTFILDPAGRVLWQDIGPDPFEDPKFVLQEGLRLLELHKAE